MILQSYNTLQARTLHQPCGMRNATIEHAQCISPVYSRISIDHAWHRKSTRYSGTGWILPPTGVPMLQSLFCIFSVADHFCFCLTGLRSAETWKQRLWQVQSALAQILVVLLASRTALQSRLCMRNGAVYGLQESQSPKGSLNELARPKGLTRENNLYKL